MGEGSSQSLVQSLIDVVNAISLIGDFRKSHKKECAALVRRVKLLAPLFEEVREMSLPLPDAAITCFKGLYRALCSAKELLRFCYHGSTLYLIMERLAVTDRFQKLTAEMGKGLDGLPFDLLDVSDEVQEQIELLHTQLMRAKGRVDPQDVRLHADLISVLGEIDDKPADPAVLGRLANGLELNSTRAIREESHAIQEIMENESYEGAIFPEGVIRDNDKGFEQMFFVLRKLRRILPAENLEIDLPELERTQFTVRSYAETGGFNDFSEPRTGAGIENRGSQNASEVGTGAGTEKEGRLNVPDDFKCPISLEMMKDPVFVATGQTYERACIQKWLETGHRTCPKTGVTLHHTKLTPNYVLRSLIEQWCKTHGIEVPKRSGIRVTIDILVRKLSSGQIDMQRAAAGEIRLLAKRNVEHRVCIAEAGAIPRLVDLLTTSDPKTQEHAVTALLNLSINDNNKGAIVLAGAIYPIVEVLRNGSKEARENAAATLFSLSVVDENKVTIGASGAIPALVDLLRDGSSRGKKDAATALFNLSIYQGNKARAVRAGVVPPLMKLLEDQNAGMVDEALAILAILATHQEGKVAIGQASAIPTLVEIIRSGAPRNKENAAAVLLALSSNDSAHIAIARQLGAHVPLSELARDGTPRAMRKAALLLEHIKKQEQPLPFTGLEGCM